MGAHDTVATKLMQYTRSVNEQFIYLTHLLNEDFHMQHSSVKADFQPQDVITNWPLSQPMPAENQTFYQKFETSLKHSNATQNVYFSNFFEWQGAARERWFFECISNDMLQDLGVFITKKAHNEYLKEAFPFQTVTCSVNSFAIQKCSFYLQFKFFINDELASVGYQQIVFADKQKRIAKLPDHVLSKIRLYECDNADFSHLK